MNTHFVTKALKILDDGVSNHSVTNAKYIGDILHHKGMWAEALNKTKLKVIAKALGHSHTATTMIYIQGESDDKVAEANRMVLCNFKGLMCK